MGRVPEQPTWALAMDHDGHILRVREAYLPEKVALGWIVVAQESEFLPWPVEMPVTVQSNPRRTTDHD